jgi:hypothetical protein
VTKTPSSCLQYVDDRGKYLSFKIINNPPPSEKQIHDHDSDFIGKLTYRDVLVVFNSVVEELSYVICDIVTLYVCVETTSVPYERIVLLEPVDQTINCHNIGLMMLINLRSVCTCHGVHVFLPSEILYVVLY